MTTIRPCAYYSCFFFRVIACTTIRAFDVFLASFTCVHSHTHACVVRRESGEISEKIIIIILAKLSISTRTGENDLESFEINDVTQTEVYVVDVDYRDIFNRGLGFEHVAAIRFDNT